MKYLRRIYENNQLEIIQNIKDIFLELNDIGYMITLEREENHYIKIKIRKYNSLNRWSKFSGFNYKDVDEYIKRVIDYLSENEIKLFCINSNDLISNEYIEEDSIVDFEHSMSYRERNGVIDVDVVTLLFFDRNIKRRWKNPNWYLKK
jgi:hypothetical protein